MIDIQNDLSFLDGVGEKKTELLEKGYASPFDEGFLLFVLLEFLLAAKDFIGGHAFIGIGEDPGFS